MKRYLSISSLLISVLASSCNFNKDSNNSGDTILWYQQPAEVWEEALPIGNGTLGAMAFGGTSTERIQFNEATLWLGGSFDGTNPEAAKALPEVRKLIFEGKYTEAHELANKKMMGVPKTTTSYLPFEDLYINFNEHKNTENYKRTLDLSTAITDVNYTINGVTYHLEVFSSPVDKALVIHITTDKPGAINFSAGLNSIQKSEVKTVENKILVLSGIAANYKKIKGVTKFEARLTARVKSGETTFTNDSLYVKNDKKRMHTNLFTQLS
jgi:alpha-L-fucosidase 2